MVTPIQHCCQFIVREYGMFAQGVTNAWGCASQKAKDLAKTWTPAVARTAEKVYALIPSVLFGLAATGLVLTQSSLFGIGFLVAIVNPSMMNDSNARIAQTWNRQHFLIKSLVVGTAIISWPISLAASAFFVGGQVSLLLSHDQIPSSSARA
jgi:hypothetical protein